MAKGKGKKRKAVNVRLTKRKHGGKITEPFRIMESLIEEIRSDLKDAKINIGIAWRSGWQETPEGKITLSKCTKRGDLDRELDQYDFIIELNEEAWGALAPQIKERLLFHELFHAQLSLDSNGKVKRDDRDRVVCRVRKHDIEEFDDVISRYGSADVNKIAKAAIADSTRPLLAEAEKKEAARKKTKGMQATVQETEKEHT